MSDLLDPPGDFVFENPDPRGGHSFLLILGGIGLIVVAIGGFIISIGSRQGQISLHLMTTMPMIIAVGVLARGFSLRNLPRRIVVGPDALEITTDQSTSCYAWSELGSATTAAVLNSHKTCLKISNTAGKTIIRIDESFPDYPRLTKLVETFIDAKPDDTSMRILSRKAKRVGLVCFVFGCVLAAGAVFIAITTREMQRANELLSLKGVPGEGEIVRRFVAPNGVTKRIEYRVAGSTVNNVEVESRFWNQLEDAKTVPVVYVPEEPNISRLQEGVVPDDDLTSTPGGGYLLSGLGGLMALFVLGYSPLAWMGYDLVFDEKQRVWMIKRYGRAVWTSTKQTRK